MKIDLLKIKAPLDEDVLTASLDGNELMFGNRLLSGPSSHLDLYDFVKLSLRDFFKSMTGMPSEVSFDAFIYHIEQQRIYCRLKYFGNDRCFMLDPNQQGKECSRRDLENAMKHEHVDLRQVFWSMKSVSN